nr:hypothetical protein [Tanacetum cinerariifolium]
MVAFLEKAEGNSEFQEIVDFLKSCTIHHALTGTNRSEGDQVQLPHDSPLSGGHTSDRAEGALNLEELFSICTNLSNRVFALETVKDAQAVEIIALKARIKMLKKKCKPSISHHKDSLKNVQRLSMKKRFTKKDSVSKQGRKKEKPEPTLDDITFDGLDADLDVDHAIDYMDTEELVNEGRLSEETEELKLTTDTKEITQDKGSGEKGGSTKELVSTARPEDSTVRPDTGTADPIAPPTTTSIFNDEDITMAQTLIKMKEEKAKEKGVSIKDIEDSSRPARLILTLKPLPTIDPKDKGKGVSEEPEPTKKMTRIEDRAKFLVETIAAQTRFRAVQRFTEIRSRPPTKSQLRNLMMTYLKNIGGYKHSQLKAKTFAEIQDKEKVLEEPDSTKVKVKQEGNVESTRERPGRRLKMKATKKSKRQKTNYDLKEEEHLKTFLQIVPDEEGEVDYEVLNKRMDLEELYNIVMQRFETTSPEGVDLVLWGNLRTMFEETAEDDLWKNQEEWILKSWNFYEICGVHTLTFKDVEYESEAVFDLLRFVQKQIDESRSYDGSEKDLVPCYCNKTLAISKQTATDTKDWKLIKEKFKELQCVWIHPPGVQEAQDEET